MKKKQPKFELSDEKNKIEARKEYVLKLLKLGYSQGEIGGGCGLKQPAVCHITQLLIETGKISQEEINEAKFKRADKIKNDIFAMTKHGCSVEEISEYLDVETSKIEVILEKENKKVELENYIINMLRDGYSQQEIANNYQKENLCQAKISMIVRQLVEEGRISQEEIIELRKIRAERSAEKAKKKAKSEPQNEENKPKVRKLPDPKKIESLTKNIFEHPQLITVQNVKPIVLYYIEINKVHEAIKFINRCINENKYQRESLIKIRDMLEERIKKNKAKKLIKSGYYSDDEIASEVGLTAGKIREVKAELKKENEDLDR